MDLPSRLDYFAIGRDYVRTRAKKIDPKQIDTLGSDVNIFVGSASVLADAVTKQLGFQINRLLLDGAEGEDLDRLAWDRFGLVRKGASPAKTSVILRRPTATAGAGNIQLGSKITSKTGAEYITTTVAAFGPTDLESRADVRASQAGKLTQVGANSLQRWADVSKLFDTTITVNNEQAAAGGEEVEGDDTFRNRIRNFWRTARKGITAAIEQGALSVPGVVSAQAIEVVTTIGGTALPAKIVLLYIADSSGVASDALAQDVEFALDEYRCAGIKVLIGTSIPQIVTALFQLSFRANVDTVNLTNAILAAGVEFINSLPVNAPLLRKELGSVLVRFKADGLIVTDDTIVAPLGDLYPEPGKTLRTTLANVRIAA